MNSPHATVLSGDPEPLTGIVTALRERGVFCSQVQVDYASHAPQVEPLCPGIETSLTDLRPKATTVPMHSTVRDRVTDGTELDGRYWADNLRLPVRFSSAVQSVLVGQRKPVLFLEISPHPVLRSAVEDCIEASDAEATTACSLFRELPERLTMLETVASAYTQGCEVTWTRLTEGGRFTPLPGYPWQSRRFWVDDTDVDLASLVRRPARNGHRPPVPVRQPEETLTSPAARLESPADGLEDLLRRTSTLLGVDTGTTDVSVSLTRLGMNSLFAAKLVYQLRSELGITISIRELLGGASVQELADLIDDRLPRPARA